MKMDSTEKSKQCAAADKYTIFKPQIIVPTIHIEDMDCPLEFQSPPTNQSLESFQLVDERESLINNCNLSSRSCFSSEITYDIAVEPEVKISDSNNNARENPTAEQTTTSSTFKSSSARNGTLRSTSSSSSHITFTARPSDLHLYSSADNVFEPPSTVPVKRRQSHFQAMKAPLLKLAGRTLSAGTTDSEKKRKFSLPPKLSKSRLSDIGLNLRPANSVDLELNRLSRRSTVSYETGSKKPSHEFRLKDQLFSFFQPSDNKLAMKLFGSKTAVLKEKRRQIAIHSWIIHPCSNFRLYWDLLMLAFLFINLVVLPISISFFFDDIGTHWLAFNITCDSVFILDIMVNFRTGIVDAESHGDVILDSKVIALRYIKSWFIIDLISSMPIDYVFLHFKGESYSAGRALRILRLAKVLQLLRLLRISRLVRYVRIWQEFFSLAGIVVRIFNVSCVMILIAHWSGCIQFFVPAVLQGWPEDSWISLNNLRERGWWEQYTKALFKALSHMLCIGYGQFPPRNMTDTWLTIASMLAGATCYALFIGHSTTLIQSFDTSSRQFRDHIQQVNEYMAFRKLPNELRRRITDYYEHRFGGKMFDEQAILQEISDTLRKDITNHNCAQLASTVPFFVNADPNFVTDVITKLRFEMCQPGDMVVTAGTKGDCMYFIQEGVVEIVRDDDSVVTRLADGSYFGEIALLSKQKRTASVRAITYCNLFSLDSCSLDNILESYPLMKRTLETIAAKRLHTLGKNPAIVTSRESLLDDIHGIQRVLDMGMPNQAESHETLAGDSKVSPSANKQFLTAVKGFFTNDSEYYAPNRLPSPPSRAQGQPFHNNHNNTNTLKRCRSNLQSFWRHKVIQPVLSKRSKSSCELEKVCDWSQLDRPFSEEEKGRFSASSRADTASTDLTLLHAEQESSTL